MQGELVLQRRRLVQQTGLLQRLLLQLPMQVVLPPRRPLMQKSVMVLLLLPQRPLLEQPAMMSQPPRRPLLQQLAKVV